MSLGPKPIIGKIFAKKCMKIKEIGTLASPLPPPPIRQWFAVLIPVYLLLPTANEIVGR